MTIHRRTPKKKTIGLTPRVIARVRDLAERSVRQDAIAVQIGIAQSSVSKILSGHRYERARA